MVDSRLVTVARARPFASRSRAKPSMSARRTANSARDRARHQLVNWRRSSAYASRVRPRYPARNPARASRSASVKAGWIMTRAVDGAAVVIGHLPAGLRPEKLGQLRIPAIERKFKPKPPGQSRYVTVLYRAGRGRLRDKRSRPSMGCVFTATSPRTSGTELLVLARFLEGWVHPSKNLACAGRRAGSARRV